MLTLQLIHPQSRKLQCVLACNCDIPHLIESGHDGTRESARIYFARVYERRSCTAAENREILRGRRNNRSVIIFKLQLRARRSMIRKLMHCYATPIANCTKAYESALSNYRQWCMRGNGAIISQRREINIRHNLHNVCCYNTNFISIYFILSRDKIQYTVQYICKYMRAQNATYIYIL